MDILLIAGLWLPVSIWDDTAAEIRRRGHRPVPVALPGVDDAAPTASLGEQELAVLAAVDAADRPLVVGHSAASTLAWIAADRRAEDVAGAVLIGGMPTAAGAPYAEFFPLVDGVMPFPGWEPFDGPDTDDLDEASKERIASIAVPVAGGVASGIVDYGDPRRRDVPTVMVCPEYSPEDAKEWLAGGHIPELEPATRLTFVDIDSGHWPMVSRPDDLARILVAIADELAAD